MVTVHSHPGAHERNALSGDDLAAHERVFPHLLDITGATSVTGVALGEASAAGESWYADGNRRELTRVQVIGASIGPCARARPRTAVAISSASIVRCCCSAPPDRPGCAAFTSACSVPAAAARS